MSKLSLYIFHVVLIPSVHTASVCDQYSITPTATVQGIRNLSNWEQAEQQLKKLQMHNKIIITKAYVSDKYNTFMRILNTKRNVQCILNDRLQQTKYHYTVCEIKIVS